MNYIYASLYLVASILLFLFIFMFDETFNFLFEINNNNILDYNHPEYTGGITIDFNPLRHFKNKS